MGSADRIRDLLPSLWRPDPEESGLLSALLAAAGGQLDQVKIAAGDTMQAHWLMFADSALLAPYVSAFRREQGKRPLLPGDPEVLRHPYVDDLARLANLLGLAPHTEPLDGRETVEAFRSRILATVRLWQDGIATRAGILGAARLALSGLAERALQIEEFAPSGPVTEPIAVPGLPEGLVGPLMRWRIDSRALLPTPVEIYIEGLEPVPGEIDATENPIIELFDPATGTGTGIAYQGSIAPGRTLALLPTHTSWLGGQGGLLSATSVPADGLAADPTAPGPWTAVAGAPEQQVRALVQVRNGAVWAAVATGAAGALWRIGKDGWELAIGGLTNVFCLLAEGDLLTVGHAGGLGQLRVFDAAPAFLVSSMRRGSPAVHALARDRGGTVWAATARGAVRIGPRGGLTGIGPGARAATATPLHAVQADEDGIIHFGGPAGLFRYDPSRDTWHVYLGNDADETVADWREWNPALEDLPADGEVFLPAVTALLRGPDQSLWIGTSAGLARYRANRRRGTYATRLEAFPDLGTEPVRTFAVDERQRLWVGTDRGLLVFDGTDWFQSQAGALVRLPRRAASDPDRAWRFARSTEPPEWQSALAGAPGGFKAATAAPITADEAPIGAILWTDGAIARFGTLSAEGFAASEDPVPGTLRRRIKPIPTLIVDGVLPAIPRVAPDQRDFRYLAIEEGNPPTPKTFPAWTREGRLLLPARAAAAPKEGRYMQPRAIHALDTVFAYNPAARVTFRWSPRAAFSVTARMQKQAPDETLAAVVAERVFASMDLVRPAGAQVRLAHGETVVKGGEHG